ncbi:hypothetical protein AN9244.2 [Aspergillus nidulans FGSC A4]|uniref:Nonribosomal peptide synthase, putative (JCVI) n=1 Tax=Emericella nidulans (strain FGSC A4 / ATCC 38163 / CBS 112.46 / NRRL 194 / M139) TaxID=227321 RepID=Q5AR36_EMENI|nr:hypothetical protein [Aspergillus nidulans FGSC A4]EAA66311.1 hypothetical protein AN9244.2 [Aspergillus nidulans FGSC A4]CBF87236.1 TPA: nonribosomal peptide synthase, putative (JCVI) [Aspergillus nidulans FGSC A4]|eukprot:XP_682513.1 hypothetical protein AN9244.2 [Aspergillus nidulans FGSC A4]
MAVSVEMGQPLKTACRFPVLRYKEDDAFEKLTHERTNIQVLSKGRVQDLLSQEETSLQGIFQTIWAITLKIFTGDESICAASLRRRGTAWQYYLFSAEIGDEMPFSQLSGAIHGENWRIGPLNLEHELPCDSGLCMLEENESVEDEILKHASRIAPCDSHMAPAYASIVAATISHIFSQVQTEPCLTLGEMHLLHPEVEEDLRSWSSIPPPSVDDCVGPMFERKVRERPLDTAVNTSELTLSYRDLDLLSVRLAVNLQAKGVKPESIIVLCFPKSAWAVVAMMAVIRAGGAILFLNPSHPTVRHQEIIGQVDADLILTAPEYGPLWEWFTGEVLLVNRSTSKPKGCVVEHRQFLTGALAQQKVSKMTHADRVLQLASFTFDVSILEIFTPLISGACVCIPNDQERARGPAACIQQFSITWAFLTPSLVSLMSPDMVPTLRFLFLGGEAVQKENIQVWASHVRLANGYGPTECSIAATANPQLSPTTSPANIGYPLGGCCWIVSIDDHNRLMPIGAPGELVIQGPIVARGYLNEPEKTQAVFLETMRWMESEPTSTSRLYKTGDIARFNADGSLHFIGRKDSQVKLRGLQNELGEIEHRIVAHPLVEQAVVVLAQQGPCKGKLTAVVSLKNLRKAIDSVELVDEESFEAATDELKAVAEALSQQLPGYMQPTVWVPVGCIPLTSPGKQNRVIANRWVAALSSDMFHLLTGRQERAGEERVQPSTAKQRQLQSLCSAVLGLDSQEEIWLSKSFIQNGGNSIQAMQLLDHLRRRGLGVKIEDIFTSPTLIELALHLTESEETPLPHEESAPVALDKKRISELGFDFEQVEDLYPISPVQRGILLTQQQSPEQYQLRITCRVIPVPGEQVDRSRLHMAWQQVAARHPALRTIFVKSAAEDGLYDQLVYKPAEAAFLLWERQDEDAVWKALKDFTRQDNPDQPPVTSIISTTVDGKTFCTVDISRALIDGVSILIMFRDLSRAYAGLLEIGEVVRYSPYIRYVQTLPAGMSIDYWGSYLEAASPCHFPVLNDDIQGENKLHALTVDLKDAKGIHAFCARHNVTPAIVFQMAWALVLKAYTGQDDICFGYLTAGRDVPVLNISDAVGVFDPEHPLNRREEMIRQCKAGVAVVGEGKEALFQGLVEHVVILTQDLIDDLLVSEVSNIQAAHVDTDQSFLALGGDSITTMQVSSGSRSRGLQLAVKHILRSKIIRGAATQASHKTKCICMGTSTSQRFSLLSAGELEEEIDALVMKLGYSGADAVEDAYPCSPMQEDILISQATAPEMYKFFAVCSLRARNSADPVNIDRVQLAWRRLVARHPALRTFFVEGLSQDGLYTQIVLIDHEPQIQHAADLDSLFKYPEDHPLDYRDGAPPHRLTISQGGDGVVFINLEISHTLIDGSSMAIILGDLVKAYDDDLPTGPLYRHYIAAIQARSTEKTLAFWTAYLQDVKPVFFPALLEEHTAIAASGERKLQFVNVHVGPATVLDLQSFTKKNEVTLANIFQAVWALALRVYTRGSDVVFGYLSSGRDVDGLDMDMDSAVGAFITMLPCRVQVDDDCTLLDLTRKLYEDYVNSLPHQQTSLAQVQHALELSGERLFNSVLSLQQPMVEAADRHSIEIEYLGGSDPTEYDLGISITAGETDIDVAINYWSTFMSKEQAQMLASTFSTILSRLVEEPTSDIRDIDFLGDKHMQYILDVTHQGQVPEAMSDCIHTKFQKRAIMHPDALAIDSCDATMTYRELDQLSTRLATYLISLGVRLEDAVPLCFDKSSWAVVSMLAVLKAGGAYVSMSPSHPVQHLANIIVQTKARIVLAGSTTYGDMIRLFVDRTIVVDSSLLASLLPLPDGLVLPHVSPANAAMINFTSGSTGEPKGIVVLHKGICTMMEYHDLRIGPASRTLQFSAYTFDTSNGEIFITLCRGGCLCIPSEHDRMNDLPGLINRLAVTHALLTPSVALFLSPESVPMLQMLGFVGEAVPAELVRRWHKKVVLINSYGPAECSIMASLAVLHEDVAAANIGRGNGCLLWVTDPENSERLVPVGCVGELLIEGPLVTRGYLDAELTARSFIMPPRWRGETVIPGTKLYKTRDLVRYADDGSLVYMGRKDSQVKLNGQRVEMGAIEMTINNDALVKQCVLCLPKVGPCKKKLVAVVVLEETASKDITAEIGPLTNLEEKERATDLVEQIKDRLASTLPRYMIPSVWLVTPNLPFTPSRKVDRPMISRWVDTMDHETYTQALAEFPLELADTSFF